MSAVKMFLIRCDLCGYTDENIDAETMAGARRTLRADGWTRPRAHAQTICRIDACSTCSAPESVSPVPASPNPPTPETSAPSPHSGQEPTPQHDDKAGR